MYDACEAMRDAMLQLGVAIDGGKDSLSMAAIANGETVRAPGALVVTVYAAVPDDKRAEFADSAIVLATPDGLRTVMLKKGRFGKAEIDKVATWADTAKIELVYLPGRGIDNGVQEFILTEDKAAFTRQYEYDIRPTTDDWPYFFSFLRWDKPEKAAAMAA